MAHSNAVGDRFLDAAEEPKQALMPIEGYENKPLVSLENAVKPIEETLYNLDTKVKTAKWNARQPPDGLTCDESAAIQLYTMEWPEPYPSLYTLLNEQLRSTKRKKLTPWFLYLKLFLTALYKLPTFKGVIWRGVREDLSAHYNDECIWWGVSSCSKELETTKEFIGRVGKRTLFNIECVNGKAIKAHSFNPQENEIILMPGTYFRVISKLSPAQDLHIIQLREAKPPYQTIAPPFPPLASPVEPPSVVNLRISNENKSVTSKMSAASVLSQGTQVSSRITNNTQWKQHAITVAGGNGIGDKLNQLYWSFGLSIDNDQQTIYIADSWNNRIVEGKFNAKTSHVIAGGHGLGNQMNQLNDPTDVQVDTKNNSLIICDYGNRRVVEWSRQNGTKSGQVLISNIDCLGITMDKNGYIYVSDTEKHEVRRWKKGETNGIIVAGGNGKGEHLNQLNWPTYLFVDQDNSLYISDYSNHRVMKWMKNAKEGIITAGGLGQGDKLTQLSYPQGVIVDHLGNVYVADSGNYRIMCWSKGSKQGRIIVGGNGNGQQSNQLNYPQGISFDCEDNLYVVDWNNHRVQKFEIDKY